MNDPLLNISYGLFVITANKDGRDNGCIADAFQQVTSLPEQVSLCLNKSDFTCDLIVSTGKFTVSIISENADFELFRTFGFQSGRNIDKFANFGAVRRLPNDTLAIIAGTNSYLTVNVNQTIDLGTHLLFIGKVDEKEVLNDEPSMTYAYYRKHMRKSLADNTDGSHI
ncbi:MAG: flavin reductase family protein [Muribaculaceae bacterium]|nr:flavin reductase family protein [Muribaculaceae bacterium]MDE7457247.1 flavin reductase family protein [Muribaculaceae bacterium]